MATKPTRGFNELLNEKIVRIDTSVINVVTLVTESGKLIEIDGEENHLGIPVIWARKVK